MTTDELETMLRAWGRVYGEKPPAEWDGEGTAGINGMCRGGSLDYGINPIARGMEFAPGKRVTLIRQRTNMDRGGFARRATLAVAACAGSPSLQRMRAVPMAYVDHIPCVESRSHRSAARDWPVPPDLQRIQRAALDLLAFDTLRGLCLRVNYCTRGSHEDKAANVSMRLGSPVKLKRYRDELSHARTWIHGRIAA